MTANVTPATPLLEVPLSAKVQAETRRYQRSARADNTLRAYRSSLALFSAWCVDRGREAMPATPATVAAFLAAEASAGRAPATVALRAAAIAFAHRTAGLPNPCDAAEVTETLRGVRRESAQARHAVVPALCATVDAGFLLCGFS